MKGYSLDLENGAKARVEGVNASYKDLAAVCGVIRNKRATWAMTFLERASLGEIPVLFRKHNKNLGHRRELGGRMGRYPEKAAGIVLKVLKSALANATVKGMDVNSNLTVAHASANKKMTYPRMAPKGRTARSNLETARVEIILLSEAPVPKSAATSKKESPASKSAPVNSVPSAHKKSEPVKVPQKSAEKKEAKK
ncbi:50S ribosomal protein L22 [Candidatus Micrarchaeota archaeon]|nr:50S ribosomal protein L22 [Candidatus Micrarchaeota archaeon]